MDVAGAAIATVFAQFVSVVCSVVVLRKQDMPIEFSREQCRIYKEELGKILNVGVPIALQETTVQISFLVVNSVINQMGLMPSAGYGIAQKKSFPYYAGSILCHAECISICCAEYWCRKEKPGMEGFLHCNHYRMFRWNHHLYRRILRRRSIILFLLPMIPR